MSRNNWEDQGTLENTKYNQDKAGDESHDHMTPLGKRIVFSKEELRVLRECNHESFYYRCVPLGIIFIGTTQILTNRGVLRPNKKYGALFKNLAAGLAAFMLGKLSYQGTCRAKIMQLENSPLADAMRKGRWGPEVIQEMMNSDREKSTDDQNTFQSDALANKGPNMFGMPAPSSTPQIDSNSETKSDRSLTYDDLRQRHRKEFENKYTDREQNKFPYLFKSPHTSPSPPSSSPTNGHGGDLGNNKIGTGSKKNKYGDEIE